MIRSMTAFAGGERITPWGTLGCELRSVNHRFLEVGVRLPEELRALEPLLRERIAAKNSRGKLDLTLRLRAPESAQTLAVNESLLQELGALATRLDGLFPKLQVASPICCSCRVYCRCRTSTLRRCRRWRWRCWTNW